MKKIILFTILIFACMACRKNEEEAIKPYVPMIVAGNQWNEMFTNGSVAPEYQYQRTSVTIIGNDTLINGLHYYQLLTARDSLSEIWEDNGYVREDATQRKVYYKPVDKPEFVLYAFGLKTGDVVQSYDFKQETDNWVLNTVINVEPVIINAVEREKITISSTGESSSYGNHIWIEGIGGMDGWLNSYVSPKPGSGASPLLCFFQTGELVYKPAETGISDCFIWKYTNR
jgi:hypothetical protein